ncbi:MAG: ParB/RepB/Spo0J family partition protein [Bacilli bacterium]|jgi:ParB family chromosome partitioning protein|nr:ParB/RepB/Spo0J family partition protein [Bacilli bacterium]
MTRKSGKRFVKESLSDLVRKFSKNDVIAEIEKEYQSQTGRILPLSVIDDNAFVKRVRLPEEAISQVSKSIAEKGLWNPLVVRPSGGHYELILGRKRFYGAKRSGIASVNCVVVDVGDEETLLMLLADTRDQRNGNVVEMALVYQALIQKFDYSPQTLANLSHQSRSQVANTMRILKLPDHIITDLCLGKLSYGHAKAIASLSDEEIEGICKLIHREKLSVRDTEILAKQYSKIPQIQESEADDIKKALGADSVVSRRTSISISFANAERKNAFVKSLLKKK